MPSARRSTNLQKRVHALWQHYSEKIQNRFGLETSDSPNQIIELKSKKPQRLGGDFRDGTLYIANQVLKDHDFFEAIIAKACLKSALEPKTICPQCIDDLSNEFARQNLKGAARERWTSEWAKYAPPQIYDTVRKHDPTRFFPIIYNLVGESGLDQLVHEIVTMMQSEIHLEFEDYLSYLQRRYQQLAVKLDKTELKLISQLLTTPSFDLKALSNEVGITEQWVSRKISELRKRYILRKFERMPFSRIGIRMFYLLGRTEGAIEDSLNLLTGCPFLYSFRQLTAGSWQFLATLCVPDNKESMKQLEQGQKHLADRALGTTLWELASSGVSVCFDYYSPEEGQWDIPWSLLGVQLKRIHTDGLADVFPRVDKPQYQPHVYLDDLDLRILDCVRQGINSVSRVRERLRVGQHRVAQRLKDLKKASLIVTTWEVHNIGLVESAIVICPEKKEGEAIAGWAQRLPRCVISFDANRSLVLTAELPTGGGYGLAATTEGLPGIVHTGMLSKKIYGQWGFPTELWDVDKQQWLCPREKLEDWLSKLG